MIINQRAVHRNHAFDGDQQDIIPRNQQNIIPRNQQDTIPRNHQDAVVDGQQAPTVGYQQNLPGAPSTDSIDVSWFQTYMVKHFFEKIILFYYSLVNLFQLNSTF